MVIKTFPVGEYGANCYLVMDSESKEIIVIDPGANANSLIGAIDGSNCKLQCILLTHGHFDHVGAVVEIKKKYNVPVYIHIGEIENMNADNFVYTKLPEVYEIINDSDEIKFADKKIKCIHTPGHSKGGMCFLIDDCVFTGDTLFQGSIGRTDMISGSFNTLIDSIEKKLMVLDKNTKVYPGHGPSSTIIFERMRNPFLHGDEF